MSPLTVADPGFPVGGGADLRRVHFLAKMYAKTKEIDAVGGGAHAGGAPWIRQWLKSTSWRVTGLSWMHLNTAIMSITFTVQD